MRLAHHLGSNKLPFLFGNSYDQAVIPDDLSAIVPLETVPPGRIGQRCRDH